MRLGYLLNKILDEAGRGHYFRSSLPEKGEITMSLVWTESLAVGHGLIDVQHRELFQRYNSLLQACKEGHGREELEPALDFLAEYVTKHFADSLCFLAFC